VNIIVPMVIPMVLVANHLISKDKFQSILPKKANYEKSKRPGLWNRID